MKKFLLILLVSPLLIFFSCSENNTSQPETELQKLEKTADSECACNPHNTVTIWDTGYRLTQNKHTMYNVGLSVTNTACNCVQNPVSFQSGMVYDMYVKYSDDPILRHFHITNPAGLSGDVDGDETQYWDIYVVFTWQGVSVTSNTVRFYLSEI